MHLFFRRFFSVLLFTGFTLSALVTPAAAYIGPGAGFAVAGSGAVFFASFLMLLATAVVGPALWMTRWFRGRAAAKKARAHRVVILGLDGLDPMLVEQYMAEGALPHLEKLKTTGGYRHLRTTLPALSPVAWSSFQTGVNPGAHNIFDFITRDRRTCLPALSSTRTESRIKKLLWGTLGSRKTSVIKLLRGSQPFWKILGKHGIFSNVIRVPVSYPPEPFFGNLLAGMCTPDLRGSQGTFMFFQSGEDREVAFSEGTGGVFHQFTVQEGVYSGWIEGPEGAKVPFTLRSTSSNQMELHLQGTPVHLALGVLSPWQVVTFSVGGGTVSGIVRFCLRKPHPQCALYISPVNVNPEKPVLPISYPKLFSTWIAKRQGLFGTLGLMEDTWGRNEHALDDALFLKQCYDTHAEREQMFFAALERTRKGLCTCVFDASDRIQHMFWRYIDPQHPSPLEGELFRNTIREMYQRMDVLVGRTVAALRPNDWLIVMSDHGFASFRRGVNINRWLLDNGYLVLKEGAPPDADYLQNVDWTRTKAYGIGLAGLFINKEGRERLGIVGESEFQSLRKEIAEKLESLRDPLSGEGAIEKVYIAAEHYAGRYTAEAPDLIVGYKRGYRVSWDSVTGKLEPEVFSNNTKAWSGDHHVDPSLVPGILFSNRGFVSDSPRITDLAPTVLNIFGVPVPPYMEGTVIQ